MEIKRIDSPKNPTVKWINKLQQKSKFRKTEGLYIVEGYKQVRELREDRIHTLVFSKMEDLVSYNDYRHVRKVMVDTKLFQEISTDMSPQGILAVVHMPALSLYETKLEGDGLYLALDTIQDPGNLGTMIRVADAVGAKGLIMNSSCVDLYNPKVVKSTMGSLEHIKCFVVENLCEALSYISERHITTYGAYLDDSKFHYDYTYEAGCCFVIGNEGGGISDAVIDRVDHRVKIPMPGQSESLNAAIAAAVLLYEARRQLDS